MIKAELPLYESLIKLQNEGLKLLGKGFSNKLQVITGKMKESTSISAVFEGLVPRDELSVINAAERSGSLADGFLTLVNIIKYNAELSKKLISAVTFPIIMFILALIVIAGYAAKVFPAFEGVVPVDRWPGVTQALYHFGNALINGLWAKILVVVIALVFLIRFMMGNLTGFFRNNYMDKILPFSTYKQINASIFLNNLALMLRNGIPLNDALEIIKLNSNRWLTTHINTMLTKMADGLNYGEALNSGLFSPEELLNISLYASLPSFNEVLSSVSDKSRMKIQEYILKLSGLLKSLSTLVLGGCVIWVFIALFALSDALSKMSSF
jgi:toxin co-regulated pilus biosynthesis protein E